VADTRYSALRVGLLIAAGLGILAFAIVSIGQGTRFFSRGEIVETHFRRINNLQAGAPVTLSGVQIGAVDAIYFPEDPTADYVIVRMWIERAAVERVRRDSVAQINTMGLLGDKFVELSPGSPQAPIAEPGDVLPARDPIDLESLLQKQGTDDLVANVIAISNSMRSLLEAIDQGNGVLSELVRGSPDPKNRLTVASIRETLDNVNRLSMQMEQLVQKINRGQGLAGAMLSEDTDGKALLNRLASTADSVQASTRRLDSLMQRFEKSDGLAKRLLEDEQLAQEVLTNLRASSDDLRQILHKINAGEGTVGLMVNDPTLYNELKSIFGGGTGWGLWLWQSLRGVFYPFSGPEAPPPAPQVPLPQSAPTQSPAQPADSDLQSSPVPQ
jgi:phospholipid/cholesterol/gamma-HCH transport system substrate-binding protein